MSKAFVPTAAKPGVITANDLREGHNVWMCEDGWTADPAQAILFEDEEVIKHRSTIVGLVGAVCFLFDGLVLKGRKLGCGLDRYMAYDDIDPKRLSIGMGLTGLVMAGGNSVVAWAFSTDFWLLYTTFLDIPVSLALILWAVSWARKGKAKGAHALAA